MKRLALLICLTACGDNIEPTTWGDVSAELAVEFCDGLGFCGWIQDDERALCIEHTSWHLCEPDMSCDTVVDAEVAAAAIAECRAALDADVYLDPYSEECFFLGYFGRMPPECNAVFELHPMADAGP